MTDGCLAKNYLPDPPRLWERARSKCEFFFENIDENGMVFIPYFNKTIPFSKVGELKQMLYKGNVLQYISNATINTKKMNYSKISQNVGKHRKKSWATQTDSYTSPNINSLSRHQYSITSNNVNGEIQLPECIEPKIERSIFPSFSEPIAYTENAFFPPLNRPIVKPPTDNSNVTPISPSGNSSVFPITPVNPGINNSVIEGGNLHYRTRGNICTGESITQCETNPCFPTSTSNVPGSIINLCYPTNIPTFYPRVQRTYASPTTSWSINNKMIVPAFNQN